jgi:hypothetical protein
MDTSLAPSNVTPSSRTFSTRESSMDWFLKVFELTPGRDLDAVLFKLSQVDFNKDMLRNFALAAFDAFFDQKGAQEVAALPHPETTMRLFRQLVRAGELLSAGHWLDNLTGNSPHSADPEDCMAIAFTEAVSIVARQGRSDLLPELADLWISRSGHGEPKGHGVPRLPGCGL